MSITRYGWFGNFCVFFYHCLKVNCLGSSSLLDNLINCTLYYTLRLFLWFLSLYSFIYAGDLSNIFFIVNNKKYSDKRKFLRKETSKSASIEQSSYVLKFISFSSIPFRNVLLFVIFSVYQSKVYVQTSPFLFLYPYRY